MDRWSEERDGWSDMMDTVEEVVDDMERKEEREREEAALFSL